MGRATVGVRRHRATTSSRVAAEFYNKAGERGRKAGVQVAVHPSSHHNTLLFDRADYDRIMA